MYSFMWLFFKTSKPSIYAVCMIYRQQQVNAVL